MDRIELLFLGTGTSAGVPMIGCDCDVCTSTDPHDKRTRPSVVISYQNTRVLVDTTPELRIQCLANNVRQIDAVVYTHAHADHIMGLDDVRRFNAIRNGPLDVWADQKTHAALLRCFSYAFLEPSPEQKVFRPYLIPRTIDGPFEIAGVHWIPIPLLHGDMPVLGFRVGSLAYCTDVSEIPESSFALLNDLDVLVLDALQPQKHTTHFSLEEAIAAAQRINAKQTLFTHIAHRMPHQATNDQLPAGMRLAYDGQRVVAGAGPA
ncbi:MAG TPA: MBL fold metallo-hydrolase [Humisphaera sp.]|jgi:phosphoribosyl 1,2-cyclic phosphate phosphodiesterase|nr:MBL fold metallo-hydrolase [Humisphaera sp.]